MHQVSPNHPSQIAAQAAQESVVARPRVESDLAHIALAALVKPAAGASGALARGTIFANHHHGQVLGKRAEKP